jgi:hypothetical protein
MCELNPNMLYDNGNLSGKMTKQLRTIDALGVNTLVKILDTIIAVGTADGTVANTVTAATNLRTELVTAATFDKIVQPF